MVEQAQHPYSECRLYVVVHRHENRRMACLVEIKDYRRRVTLSYARYLMAVHLKRYLLDDEEVDHINGDSMDDRLENYQILSKKAHRIKTNSKGPYRYNCPVCGVLFELKRRTKIRPNPCCSRVCGGWKAKKTKLENQINLLKDK